MEYINKIVDIKSIKKLVLVLIGTGILTISAKLQTPLAPVPATMQTFAVLFLGLLLGYKLATITVALYLFEGFIGLPVFAKGGGYAYFIGPTSGYLFGFLIGAYLAGFVKEKTDTILMFIYLLFSVSFIYLLGMIWLWSFKGFSTNFLEIFSLGAKPFVFIELYKLLILSVLGAKILKFRKFI